MRRICVFFMLAMFLTTVVAAADFSNFGDLGEDEVIVTSSGTRMMKMPEEAESEASNWDFVDSAGNLSQSKLDELYAYIEEHRASSYQTMLVPILAAGLVDSDVLAAATDSTHPSDLRIGADKSDEEIEEFLDDAGLELGSSDSEFIASDGTKYQFKNVSIHYWFQKEPNKEDEPGRADWDSSEFEDKYREEVADIGDFTLKSDISNPPYSPPGDMAFDAGVDDDETEQPLEATQSAESDGDVEMDYTMEVFVELRGEVYENGSLAYKFEEMTEPPVGRTSIYVEDYVPPMPEDIEGFSASANTSSLRPKGESDGNCFVPSMAVNHANDGTSFDPNGIDAEEQVITLNYWPNDLPIDRDGDGIDDYSWEEVQMENNNDADKALNCTLNYEVGMSLYQRVKYKDDPSTYGEPGGWKCMYYVPYRPIDGELFGPYAGRVGQVDAEMDPADKYDFQDDDFGSTYIEYYKPVVFPETVQYNGKTYKPKGLMDEIYEYADAGESVQSNYDDLVSDYNFSHIAGISCKWARECVQGITVGDTGEASLTIPKGKVLFGTGYAGCRIAKDGDVFRTGEDRLENFVDTELDNNDSDAPKSLTGTLKEGTDSRDSFFKINAADCCNNDVVIASGTFGTEDNLKPIPKLVIEEMDSHNSAGDIYLDVSTVPNDMPGAGDPFGEYNPDRVYSKLHQQTVPLYGTGTQGDEVRGYGNYSNNASTWNGFKQAQTLQNPVDQEGYPFLAMRYWEDEPNFEEDRRYQITITADDNIGPVLSEDSPQEVYYPIRHLSYKFYHHPTAESLSEVSGLDQNFTGDRASLISDVDNAIESAGFREFDSGAIIDLDVNADDSAWTAAPSQTFEYKFKSPGLWLARVDTVDRSNNTRVMMVPLGVGKVDLKTRNIETRHGRID